MSYKIYWDHRAVRKLKKLDNQTIILILNSISKLYENPEQAGKPLTENKKGLFRLRVGEYRVLYKIDKELIRIFDVGHRKNIYD